MKTTLMASPIHFLLFTFLLVTSCKCEMNPAYPGNPEKVLNAELFKIPDPEPAHDSLQIASYVRRIFQDSAGNLWFGTNGLGLACFNGSSIAYYSTTNGLGGNQVTGIIEDQSGNLWISTSGGLSRYDPSAALKSDGESFKNFTTADGLNDDWVWCVYQDSKGTIWAGTLKGVSRFDGERFKSFDLPPTNVKFPQSHLSTTRVTSITEDRKDHLWFATDGGGVYKYDGQSFLNITKEDGLCDNNINCILIDANENIWFGSMFGGLSRYNGNAFTNYTTDSAIGNDEVWNIYADRAGFIWFSSEGFGVYRYNGISLTNFSKNEGLGISAVQSIYEDKKGRFWVGGGGGLYRFNGISFYNVTRDGPWD